MTHEELAAKGLRVKELVWGNENCHDLDCDTHAFNGMYQICEERRGGVLLFSVAGQSAVEYTTIEAAKSAAQADYEARVLAALLEVG